MSVDSDAIRRCGASSDRQPRFLDQMPLIQGPLMTRRNGNIVRFRPACLPIPVLSHHTEP